MKYPKLRELKEAVKCIFSKPATVKYPYGPAIIHPKYRGKPEFQEECIGCNACKEVCPASAIEISDDIANKKRTLIRYFDRCITCGECERICTSGKGIKFLPEFALADFSRDNMKNTIERDLLVCENCGQIVATRKHILWIMEQLKEKGAAYLPFVVLSLKELGIYEEVERKITLDKRQDLFAVLCPKCRHKITLYDAL